MYIRSHILPVIVSHILSSLITNLSLMWLNEKNGKIIIIADIPTPLTKENNSFQKTGKKRN